MYHVWLGAQLKVQLVRQKLHMLRNNFTTWVAVKSHLVIQPELVHQVIFNIFIKFWAPYMFLVVRGYLDSLLLLGFGITYIVGFLSWLNEDTN